MNKKQTKTNSVKAVKRMSRIEFGYHPQIVIPSKKTYKRKQKHRKNYGAEE